MASGSGKQIWVDNSFAAFMATLEQNVNSALPKDRQLSQRELSKILPLIWNGKQVNLKIEVVEQRRGRLAWKKMGKISEANEILI